MNYKKHYEKLIEKAKNRELDCYKEVHHILPKCMNGTNDKSNLVELTAREHFIAHLLLVKIYPKEYGLIKAVQMMCISNNNQIRSKNRMYGWLREKFSETMSINQTGEGNSQFGTMWIYNTILKISKKIPKGKIPEGWNKGRRTKWYDKCKNCGNNIEVGKLYCNSICRRDVISPHLKVIEDNYQTLKEEFILNGSIDKTLRNFGIGGVRKGNSFFSSLLKKDNIEIKIRRNSKPK